jgi:hypothetical protein
MRPDMLLLNRHWQPLVVGKLAITLDTMASLIEARHGSEPRVFPRTLPRGPLEIAQLFFTTGMLGVLLRSSRLSALNIGGIRTCTHSRSEAIMSVTGASHWFSSNNLHQFSPPGILQQLDSRPL